MGLRTLYKRGRYHLKFVHNLLCGCFEGHHNLRLLGRWRFTIMATLAQKRYIAMHCLNNTVKLHIHSAVKELQVQGEWLSIPRPCPPLPSPRGPAPPLFTFKLQRPLYEKSTTPNIRWYPALCVYLNTWMGHQCWYTHTRIIDMFGMHYPDSK